VKRVESNFCPRYSSGFNSEDLITRSGFKDETQIGETMQPKLQQGFMQDREDVASGLVCGKHSEFSQVW